MWLLEIKFDMDKILATRKQRGEINLDDLDVYSLRIREKQNALMKRNIEMVNCRS